MRRGGAMRRVIALLACVARTSALAAPTRTIAEVAQLSDRMARGRRRNPKCIIFQNDYLRAQHRAGVFLRILAKFEVAAVCSGREAGLRT